MPANGEREEPTKRTDGKRRVNKFYSQNAVGRLYRTSVIIVGQRGTTGKRRRAIECGIEPVFVVCLQLKAEIAIANRVLQEIVFARRKNAGAESRDDIAAD